MDKAGCLIGCSRKGMLGRACSRRVLLPGRSPSEEVRLPCMSSSSASAGGSQMNGALRTAIVACVESGLITRCRVSPSERADCSQQAATAATAAGCDMQ